MKIWIQSLALIAGVGLVTLPSLTMAGQQQLEGYEPYRMLLFLIGGILATRLIDTVEAYQSRWVCRQANKRR